MRFGIHCTLKKESVITAYTCSNMKILHRDIYMSNVQFSLDYTYIDFKVLQRLKYAHCNNSRH